MSLHLPFARTLASLPFDLVRNFTGKSQLPIYELDKKTVTTLHARVRPLGKAKSNIRISAWRLAHAIVKADCAKHLSARFLYAGAVGFLIEHLSLFDWDPENLRLCNGMADAYVDFTGTALAGRIAQGMTILFMEHEGYAFTNHFSTFIKRHNGQAVAYRLLNTKSATSPSRKKRRKTPDFVFEKHSQGIAQPDRALVESKGGLVVPNHDPDIKDALRRSLEQLDGWDRLLSPRINKSFAVSTFLRESEDFSEEPSLIAFVDPEPEESIGMIEYKPDAIRRANYASWLTGMGFSDAADRILARTEPREARVRLPVITVGNRQYAVAITSMRPKVTRESILDDEFWMMIEDWPFWPHLLLRRGLILDVMGIELGVLSCLAEIAKTGQTERLMALEPVIQPDLSQQTDAGTFMGSVFADGTIFGELRVPGPTRPKFKFEDILL